MKLWRIGMTVVALFAAVATVSVFATGKAESSTGGTVKPGIDRPIRILGTVLSMDHTFQQELAAGFKIPRDNVKVEVMVEDPHGKVENQIAIMESYLSKDIDAWVGYPLNSKAIEPIALEYQGKKIKMVTEGNHVKYEDLGMVTQERDGGILGGQMFVKWWNENRPNEKPYILVIDHPQSEEFQKKPDAFVEYVKKNMPDAVIIGQQDGNFDVETALKVTETTLHSHPETNFVFCGVDSNVVGAMAAIEAAGRTDISVVGCGGEATVLNYLAKPLTPKKGGLAFEVAYEKSPAEFGYNMVEGAIQLIMTPDKVNKNIVDIGFFALTRDTLKAYVDRQNLWRQKAGLEPIKLSQ